MATTSIWRVKGWLGKVVIYVENPDKTTNPKFYTEEDMTERDGRELSDVIRYAVNSEKTQQAENEDCTVVHRFVSGINCSPATARDEMLAVKKRFGKENGTVAYHGYQSFAPGEVTPETAHEIGMKLAARLWGDRYQVIVATHLDKENHLHNHFVLNTVSFVDGIKYHRTKKDYHDMQTVSDELCREYRLSVIENPQYGKSKQYGEWRAEQEQRPTWRGLIRADIDEAIRQSMTERQFFDTLRKKGYEVKIGKDISVRPPGKERFVRIKYHRTKKDYHDMQTVSDELCREYRLSVIENPQYGKSKQYGEWRAEQEQRPTWRGLIRADIDEAIRQSMTERQFFDTLRKKGYEVKIGKDISVRPPGKERFVRLIRNFGEDYSIENIRRRILSQTKAERKPSAPSRTVLRVRLIGSFYKTRKITGFRALYFHYCYLLGIFPENKPKQNRRLHFLLREDLRKLDTITAETRLLVKYRIDTSEQLFSYRDGVKDKISALTDERKQLYKLQRTAAVKADPEKAAEIKEQISALSKELAALRREAVLCDGIAERSGVIKEKIKAVRKDNQPERKEKTDHVQFR